MLSLSFEFTPAPRCKRIFTTSWKQQTVGHGENSPEGYCTHPQTEYVAFNATATASLIFQVCLQSRPVRQSQSNRVQQVYSSLVLMGRDLLVQESFIWTPSNAGKQRPVAHQAQSTKLSQNQSANIFKPIQTAANSQHVVVAMFIGSLTRCPWLDAAMRGVRLSQSRESTSTPWSNHFFTPFLSPSLAAVINRTPGADMAAISFSLAN